VDGDAVSSVPAGASATLVFHDGQVLVQVPGGRGLVLRAEQADEFAAAPGS
jgi:hypothetical protein